MRLRTAFHMLELQQQKNAGWKSSLVLDNEVHTCHFLCSYRILSSYWEMYKRMDYFLIYAMFTASLCSSFVNAHTRNEYR